MTVLRTFYCGNFSYEYVLARGRLFVTQFMLQTNSLSSDAQVKPQSTPINRTKRDASSPRTRRRYVSRLFQNFGQNQSEDLGFCRSHKLMQYNEVISPCYSGAFFMLPLGQRALEKLIRVIDQEMEAVGGQKISMPTMAPDTLWKKSGRWESTGKELYKVKDRNEHHFCLGPTHEELVTSLMAAQSPVSSHQLPQLLYQISRKFRDEMSPKHGLLRGREFEMKDMYTFDTTEEAAMETYHTVCEAYSHLFNRLGVPYTKVQGATGNIGGSLSHEFHYVADVGEDRLLLCPDCGVQLNKELAGEGNEGVCRRNSAEKCRLAEHKGIEVGHCFFLGTKYSSVFGATYVDSNENILPMNMCCFGLGVTRILQASIEVLAKERQLRWPSLLSPYQVCIIPQKEGFQSELYFQLAEEISDDLTAMPNMTDEVVIDDRIKLSIGKRIYEDSRIGYPFIVALGKKALAQPSVLEVINTESGETQFLSRDQLSHLLSTVETV